jgi:hypothetical protein
MEVALRGLGATVIDTGGGITPDNFSMNCCGGWFGTTFASQACRDWADANVMLFGGSGVSYCSKEGTDNLRLSLAVAAPGSLPVPAVGYTPGGVIPDSTDPNQLITAIARQGLANDIASQTAAMRAAQAAACTQQVVTCAESMFSAFLSPNATCDGCSLDFSKPGALLLAAAVIFGAFVLIKGLR